MLLQLAWRNIWRNPRRTILILAAVTIAVWSMVFSSALMRGIADQMVRNGIATLTGHIQIHQQGFRDDPSAAMHMKNPTELKQTLQDHLPPGALFSARVRTNAVASNARHSRGVTLVGIDPDREKKLSFVSSSIISGSYLDAEDPYGIIIGTSLMNSLKTRVGNKLVVMAQDTRQKMSARAFRITGEYRAELEATEKEFVFITLPAAQNLLKMDEALSEICIVLPDREKVRETAAALARILPKDHEILAWQEMLPLVTATLRLYESIIYLWYLVAFTAMAFGLVNTFLMAVLERIREFGLLRALGMKSRWIIQGVMTESFFLLVIGIALGNALGAISVIGLSHTGIDLSVFAGGTQYWGLPKIIYPVLLASDAILVNGIVLVLGLLVSGYPALKASHFTPVEAMAHT